MQSDLVLPNCSSSAAWLFYSRIRVYGMTSTVLIKSVKSQTHSQSKEGAMRDLTEANLTEAVLAKLAGATNPRLQQVLTSLLRHLHACVREVGLTEAEWFAGIQFLTAVGQKCDAKRQEFILLSDTLGVSMLVDALNHRTPTGATESTVLGPFHVPG